MFYSFTLTVPHNTTKDSPAEIEMPLTTGTIRAVYFQFPIGTRALVHCIIEHNGHQYIPTNPDGDIVADGYNIPIENEDYRLQDRGNILKAKGWSTADTYDYDINIFVSVENLPAIEPAVIASGLDKFLKLIGIKG